jgi:hypothetical protein
MATVLLILSFSTLYFVNILFHVKQDIKHFTCNFDIPLTTGQAGGVGYVEVITEFLGERGSRGLWR